MIQMAREVVLKANIECSVVIQADSRWGKLFADHLGVFAFFTL
jgi:hypothetical protein